MLRKVLDWGEEEFLDTMRRQERLLRAAHVVRIVFYVVLTICVAAVTAHVCWG